MTHWRKPTPNPDPTSKQIAMAMVIVVCAGFWWCVWAIFTRLAG